MFELFMIGVFALFAIPAARKLASPVRIVLSILL